MIDIVTVRTVAMRVKHMLVILATLNAQMSSIYMGSVV